MFTSVPLYNKILVLVHKFIATTYNNSWHILMNLREDDDNSIELVHAVYFVSPIDAH